MGDSGLCGAVGSPGLRCGRQETLEKHQLDTSIHFCDAGAFTSSALPITFMHIAFMGATRLVVVMFQKMGTFSVFLSRGRRRVHGGALLDRYIGALRRLHIADYMYVVCYRYSHPVLGMEFTTM